MTFRSSPTFIITIALTTAAFLFTPGTVVHGFPQSTQPKGSGDQNPGQAHQAPTGTQASSSEQDGFIVPRVIINGVDIPEGLILAQLKLNCLSSTILHGAQDFDEYAVKHCPDVIDQMIGRELLVREAKRSGLTVDEEQFSRYYEDNLEMFGGREKMEQFFQGQGLTLEEHRALSRHTYMARKYLTEVLVTEEVTDDDVNSYYNENREKIAGLDIYHYSYVGIGFKDKEPDRQILKDFQTRAGTIRSTDDLKKVASEFRRNHNRELVVANVYDNKTNAKKGGVIYKQAVNMKEGQTIFFENVKPNGDVYYLLIRLEKFEPHKGPSLEEARESLKARIASERQGAALVKKVEELKENAVIKVVER